MGIKIGLFSLINVLFEHDRYISINSHNRGLTCLQLFV